MNVLVVVSVAAEADAIRAAGHDGDVVVVGVGPVAAAVGTATALAGRHYDLVLSAGIAGGFAPLSFGDVAVARRTVFADLGVESPAGVDPLDIAQRCHPVGLAPTIADRCAGVLGDILTVATVTASDHRARALQTQYPGAIAEAMEGFGVATAAAGAGVRFGEVRTISNLVGPRDRGSWRLGPALDALGAAIAEITSEPL